jgi:hypothetical protein
VRIIGRPPIAAGVATDRLPVPITKGIGDRLLTQQVLQGRRHLADVTQREGGCSQSGFADDFGSCGLTSLPVSGLIDFVRLEGVLREKRTHSTKLRAPC